MNLTFTLFCLGKFSQFFSVLPYSGKIKILYIM